MLEALKDISPAGQKGQKGQERQEGEEEGEEGEEETVSPPPGFVYVRATYTPPCK